MCACACVCLHVLRLSDCENEEAGAQAQRTTKVSTKCMSADFQSSLMYVNIVDGLDEYLSFSLCLSYLCLSTCMIGMCVILANNKKEINRERI